MHQSAGVFADQSRQQLHHLPRVGFEVTRLRGHGRHHEAGDPAEIGIHDIDTPDWGDPVPAEKDKVPVFWACGVTPQVAIEKARLPIVITHKPGHMLLTDVPEDAEIPVIPSLSLQHPQDSTNKE